MRASHHPNLPRSGTVGGYATLSARPRTLPCSLKNDPCFIFFRTLAIAPHAPNTEQLALEQTATNERVTGRRFDHF